MGISIKMIVTIWGVETMAEYYSLENKEQTTFRIDKNLALDFPAFSFSWFIVLVTWLILCFWSFIASTNPDW